MPVTAEPKWLRAGTQGAIGVDRENSRILGYVVAQAGPFKSEGRGEFDDDGILKIAELMEANPKGTKSRLGHPTLSSDGIGTFLGWSTSPYIGEAFSSTLNKVVPAVRANLDICETAFDTPGGNIGKYVLDLAEKNPAAFSTSVVITADEEYRIDEKGRPLRGDDGEILPPLWHPLRIHASDVVDTGDAVDDFLSAELSAEGLRDGRVREASRLLNGFLPAASRDVVEARLQAWLARYLNMRFGEEGVDEELRQQRIAELRRRKLATMKASA